MNVTQQVFSIRRKLQRVPMGGVGWLLLNEALPQNASLLFRFDRCRCMDLFDTQPMILTGESAADLLFPGIVSTDCIFADGKIAVSMRCPALRRRSSLLREIAGGFLRALQEIINETDFSEVGADSADGYADPILTYSELTALNSIFNGIGEDEQD